MIQENEATKTVVDPFTIDGWLVDPRRNRISHGNDGIVRLRPIPDPYQPPLYTLPTTK